VPNRDASETAERGARALRPNDLLRLRYVHDARLSPDGRRVAYVTSRTVEESAAELFEITILDLATQARHELSFEGRATQPRWSPDGKSLAFIGSYGSCDRLYLRDVDGVRALTPEGVMVQGPPAWSPDSSTIAYPVVTQEQQQSGLRRITKRVFRSEGLGEVDSVQWTLHLFDIRSGNSRALDFGSIIATQPEFSPCGKRLLFLGSDSAVGYSSFNGLQLFTVDLPISRPPIRVLDERWFISAAAWSPCGERIVIVGDYDSKLTVPMARLWVVNRDGSDAECRTTGLIGNLGLRVHHDMPTWRTSQNNIFSVANADFAYATVVKEGCGEIRRISLRGPVSWDAVVSGPRTCVIMDTNAGNGALLYASCDLNSPWELFHSDGLGHGEKRLTQLNDEVLAGWPRLHVRHLKFASRDGLPLEAWHVVREDREGPQPTVLFVHGGPMLAVGHVFRYDFHLLAANGFAVTFGNFRGSCGYGEPFMWALVGDFGSRGFPDHMATIDASIAEGLADPSRLGVWGASHGGFATCWIVGHTHRFKAAVAEASVTNFATLYYLGDWADLFVTDLGGRPDEIPDVYRSRSPLTYAHRCTTPTLMLHGEKDLRCPIAEAEQFYRALHDAGCKTELVRIPDADHMGDSIGPIPARVAQNEALLEWFERHLPRNS
jgi:dipeptidyl aminopeptidase/acylaminoacyl peptidase